MTTAPTGIEPYTPVRIKKISVTERADFRKCRRRWFLSDVHLLQGPNSAMYFQFGTAMHAALEEYHSWTPERYKRMAVKLGMEPLTQQEATFEAFGVSLDAAENKAREDLGALFEIAEPEWDAHRLLGTQMLTGYFAADAKAGFDDYPPLGKTLEVERRYIVRIPGTQGKLTGKLDLITEPQPEEIMGVDHKNLASQHSSAQLDLDDQLTGYAWLYYEATGKPLTNVAYNVLLKKGPLTKSGKPTESKLFVRDITFRTQAQLRQFEANLVNEWKDMRRVALHPNLAYPNPSAFNCAGCPVRAICVSMMNEEDVQSVVLQDYRVGEERT